MRGWTAIKAGIVPVATGLSLAFSVLAQAAPDPAYDAFVQGNYLTALEEAKDAAAKGDPAAHTLIGELYASGLGVPQDHKTAAGWYEKAANLGDANAQLARGV